MIVGCHFLSELGSRIAGHVDLSAEMGFGIAERRREFSQPDGANDQQVDVAQRMFLTARDGAVNKGAVNTALERLHYLMEGWQQSGGFLDETT
jgi:hypothetical protein